MFHLTKGRNTENNRGKFNRIIELLFERSFQRCQVTQHTYTHINTQTSVGDATVQWFYIFKKCIDCSMYRYSDQRKKKNRNWNVRLFHTFIFMLYTIVIRRIHWIILFFLRVCFFQFSCLCALFYFSFASFSALVSHHHL